MNTRAFVKALKSVGYHGPLILRREVEGPAGRLRDLAASLDGLRECLAS
jgi:hypothetical protein